MNQQCHVVAEHSTRNIARWIMAQALSFYSQKHCDRTKCCRGENWSFIKEFSFEVFKIDMATKVQYYRGHCNVEMLCWIIVECSKLLKKEHGCNYGCSIQILEIEIFLLFPSKYLSKSPKAEKILLSAFAQLGCQLRTESKYVTTN